ncbi:MAG TPA: hypothetical protein VHB20_01000 [Verrucomicrobiae bacterium]|jgi:hypothetical protein|nr:hypothetical protein [Verrucomicrobiae bacterium]
MAWCVAIACVGFLSIFIVEHSANLPGEQRAKFQKWFIHWGVKGLVFPMALWTVSNLGLIARFPPLLMEIDLANPGARPHVIMRALENGFFVIATYWAALTALWLLIAFYRESDARPRFRSRILGASILLAPLALLIGWRLGWPGLGLGGALWFASLLQVVHGLAPEPTKKPSYSRAQARMSFDKFDEAEIAVIQELEKHEDDFEGWMMLAELYAVHFHDLAEAERTVRDTCAQPSTTDSQRAVALHKLADWHLKLAADPLAARRDLEELCATVPASHLAHMARLRLKQIPASKEAWLEHQTVKKFRLPALRSDLHAPSDPASPTDTAAAIARAQRLSARLHQNPNDTADRAELAVILAEKLNKVEAALGQLELLLTIPGQPEAQAAEWLALMAAWQIKYQRNEPAARKILERILRQFPETASAFAARRRLNLMDLEAKFRQAPAPPLPPRITLLPS